MLGSSPDISQGSFPLEPSFSSPEAPDLTRTDPNRLNSGPGKWSLATKSPQFCRWFLPLYILLFFFLSLHYMNPCSKKSKYIHIMFEHLEQTKTCQVSGFSQRQNLVKKRTLPRSFDSRLNILRFCERLWNIDWVASAVRSFDAEFEMFEGLIPVTCPDCQPDSRQVITGGE